MQKQLAKVEKCLVRMGQQKQYRWPVMTLWASYGSM